MLPNADSQPAFAMTSSSLPRILDAHHHLWDLHANYYPWLTDRIGPRMYGDYAPIRRDYRVEDFRRDIGTLPVIKSVHVQAEHDPADPVRETRWLQAVADAPANRGYPHAIVAYADLSASEAEAEAVIAAHCASANVRGIRQMLHQAHVPAMGLAADYLADARWQRNLALLSRYALTFDLQILPAQAGKAARLVAQHPDLQFVLAHAGQPQDRSDDGMAAWRRALRRLAALPNVAIKLSGFGMFDPAWTVETLRPIVLAAIDCFGPQRAMFGSNFPVDGLMRGYAPLWCAYDRITAELSTAERDALFYGTAARVYRI
jgi:predicted TIM-barrel fold metal-dependent hydrolase